MATKVDNNEDDSFIILGTSPGTSMDLRCNGVENGDGLDKAQMEDAMRDLPADASMAFKAHFNLGDNPSPASMMVASTIVTEERSTEELQKRFGELLDENVILKETLKQNNDSMKEQLQLIASCQDDMLNTHRIHKEKFDETRDLVERLRQENKQLKLDAARLAESVSAQMGAARADAAGRRSRCVLEKQRDSAQLRTRVKYNLWHSGTGASREAEAKQVNTCTCTHTRARARRPVGASYIHVIVDNGKLTWQKESLEHIVDATSKERDDIKEKLKKLELQFSTSESDHAQEVKKLHLIIQNLQSQLKSANDSQTLSEEVASRDRAIQLLESKVAGLQNDLRMAQIKILDLENIKLEFTQHKSGVSETVRMYKEQIQELSTRLKDAQTTMFQPVRLSLSAEPDGDSPELVTFAANVKLYDRTLKHLADFLNTLTNGLADSLAQTLGTVASLYDYKLERASVDRFKSGLSEVKQQLERQHSNALNNIGKLRAMMSIFEGIFKDYNELLKKAIAKPENGEEGGVAALSAALVARGQELQQLRAELQRRDAPADDAELLRAQLQLYKSDFDAEREAREKMASEKEDLLAQLRVANKRTQDLTQQLDEVRKLSPSVYRTATARKPPPAGTTSSSPRTTTTTGNMVRKKRKAVEGAGAGAGEARGVSPPPQMYVCPVCDQSFKTLIFLQQHVDHCLL
ncbi:unnamed protein product, partial [Iphiclides podalirius]